jgi:hypothetical protein
MSNDLFFIVLRITFFTNMERPEIAGEGCKILAYAWHLVPLNRGLYRATPAVTQVLGFSCPWRTVPISRPLHHGMPRTYMYSNPDPHGSRVIRLLRECC